MAASNYGTTVVSSTWLVELLEAALAGSSAESPDSFLMVNNQSVSITVREAKGLLRQLTEQPLVEVVTIGTELTTGAAAQLLNISSHYLVRLCDAGDLPHQMEGAHRRLALADVLEYRERRDEERQVRFREHVRAAAEAGEYDNPEDWHMP